MILVKCPSSPKRAGASNCQKLLKGFELFEVLEEPNDEAEMSLFGGLLLPMVTPEMVYFD